MNDPTPSESNPTTESTGCPRCLGPLAQFDGDLGAASRITMERHVPICALCGVDEAVRDAGGLAPVPFDDWPVAELLTWSTGATS